MNVASSNLAGERISSRPPALRLARSPASAAAYRRLAVTILRLDVSTLSFDLSSARRASELAARHRVGA
jgi:hypothetical protein